MRASIITTIRHNVGDDFVREGILYLLSTIRSFDGFDFIHKHSPVTAVYGFGNVRSLRVSKMLEPLACMVAPGDRVKKADLLVQSGAPVYWCHPDGPHCAENEWFEPLIRKRFSRDRRGRKFLNIAGGSCQSYHSDGSEVDACLKCQGYIREFFDICDLTILRDSLAKLMLNKAGRDASVLPCTSIFARDQLELQAADGEYIVINFMENGGHYTFGQSINRELWREQFKNIARVVKKMGPVVIACHTPQEEQLAAQLVPDLDRFLVPDQHVEFMKFYARAKFGIVNRVHAGFMMASLGKPVAVIGNDSRALMINNLNLPSYYVDDVVNVGVEQIVGAIRSRTVDYPDEIDVIRRQTKDKYIEAMSVALSA
ncbi:hypothetical protein [Nevskia soli]|uniref:hypothetical protein n=1 Tax=Nevskia soli TaxID=418856 RepID=UPI0004A70481|nr:hypothetical protein [Nevskia soli]